MFQANLFRTEIKLKNQLTVSSNTGHNINGLMQGPGDRAPFLPYLLLTSGSEGRDAFRDIFAVRGLNSTHGAFTGRFVYPNGNYCLGNA